jgi:hypothetical protein
MVPTPTEILKLLLFYSNHSQDFHEIIDSANEYIMTCLIMYEMSSQFTYSTIVLASLLVVLEEKGYYNFS